MDKQKTALVAGAGGFIGSHMVKRLKSEGYWVRGVDLKHPEFSKTEADEFMILDLRHFDSCAQAITINYREPFEKQRSFDEVYQLAADMGGASYIFTGENDANVMRNSAQINLNVCYLATELNPGKIFYSSSACMYPQELQRYSSDYAPGEKKGGKTISFAHSLKESDAYPANPDSEYGWEKLFSERLYMAHARNYGLNVRIARFHNIYGPEGTYTEPKAKAPAAMCRKVSECTLCEEYSGYNHCKECIDKGSCDRNKIEVWGDGLQTRSFLYIDDCIDAVRLLMQSDFKEPINIGSEEMISINDLAKMVIDISGKNIAIKNIPGPVGVRGRNSNNELIERILGWTPRYSLRQGMEKTFSWINQQVNGL